MPDDDKFLEAADEFGSVLTRALQAENGESVADGLLAIARALKLIAQVMADRERD